MMVHRTKKLRLMANNEGSDKSYFHKQTQLIDPDQAAPKRAA